MRRAVSKLLARPWWLVAALVAVLGAVFLGGGLVARAIHDFPDVPTAAWYHDDVSWIKDRGITTGFPDGTYRPNNNVTRAEMAAFLHRMGTGGSPRAFAFINLDGSKASGTANVSSAWDAGSSRYVITIAGESYFWTSYATVVTPTSSDCAEVHPRTDSLSGDLLVYFRNAAGVDIPCPFQFATFEP